MPTLNKAMLMGNAGNAPSIITTQNGKKIGTLSLATNKKVKDANGNVNSVVSWHTIKLLGKVVDIAEKYVKKGSCIYVEGEISYRQYEKNGEKKFFTEIIANNFQLLDRLEKPEENHEQNQQASQEEYSPDDELPF